MTPWLRAGLLLAAWALPGCGRQDLDLLLKVQNDDACLAFESQSDCDANAALGCSFQPNAEGCLSTDPSCQPGLCRGGDPFVRRVERSFFLNGEPFRFAGVSSWALLEGSQCATSSPDEREAWMQQAYDGLVASRTKVARFFAFQSSAGASGTDFTLFDATVRYARRAGVRVQLILEHGDGGCSEGGHHDAAWYAGGYRNPDGKYALSYREFAEAVARRYRDEPTVLGYVLVQSLGGADANTLTGFVNDMGQLLHGVAPSQLVSLDLGWDGASADQGAGYRALQELPVVDLVDIDDYSFQDSLEPLDPALLSLLAGIDKPVVVGEGAFLLDSDADAALARRANKARERMTEWRELGFSGALLWAYQPGWTAVSEEFDARPADPMLQPDGVIANAPW
jgi:hypothetical protein